jgi:ferredoxin-NADP reductase
MDGFAQTIGLTLGWLMLAWVGLQATVVAIKTSARRARRKRRHTADRAEFCRRVEAAAQVGRASKSIAAWNGWRKFRVAAIIDEAQDVKSYYLTPEDGQPLAPYAPGQYLTFRLPVAGESAPVVRCYSLSDRPRQDYFRVSVKRIPAPRNQPGAQPGRASSYFHSHVRVGDVLEARAPAGTFLIDAAATEPIVLLGAGIGVTPLLSMLEAIVQTGQKREVHVLLGFRNGGEHPFKDRLAALRAENPQLRLHVSYSSPRSSDVEFRDFNHRGRVDLKRVCEVLPSNNYRFYVCGPGPLMESLVPALWEWGVPESHVHFEAFGPASVRSASHSYEKTTPCEVRFDRAGRSAVWNGSHTSLLEFGEAAGVKMPAGCRAGSCGECMLAIREGRVTTIKQPGIPVPAGQCLTCISVPAGELVLDA